ncbi:hypothetical protein [Streptomyces sp. NPDC001665]
MIPEQARVLVETGKVDARLCNGTALVEQGYDDARSAYALSEAAVSAPGRGRVRGHSAFRDVSLDRPDGRLASGRHVANSSAHTTR